MTWTEKEKPTPFDNLPIHGLFFLDGDAIANTREPDLPLDWAEWARGLKYPVVLFPHAEASLFTDENGQVLVIIHRQMCLLYFDTREKAYQRALQLTEEHQSVWKRGESAIELRLDSPTENIVVEYDDSQGRMIDILFVPNERE